MPDLHGLPYSGDKPRWCLCPDGEWQRLRRFCEWHQIVWCILCDGQCPLCQNDNYFDYWDDGF